MAMFVISDILYTFSHSELQLFINYNHQSES